MKMWQMVIVYIVGLLLSLGISVGFVCLCIWLGAKIVKAVL